MLTRKPIRQRRRLPEQPTKRHPVPTGPSPWAVERVMHRAIRDGELCCEVCADVVGCFGSTRGWDWSLHHRRGREGERTDNGLPNLLLCCGADNQSGCHGRIHKRRSEAQPAGWWISRIAALGGFRPDPATVPVLVDNGSRFVYLDSHGGYADNPPGGGDREAQNLH